VHGRRLRRRPDARPYRSCRPQPRRLKHITLNLIRLDPIKRKGGIKARRLIAATSDHYREHLLGWLEIHAIALLVPEGRHEVTTEGGLNVMAQESRLKTVVSSLADAGIMSSVFIDAEAPQIEAAARIGARVCEIHTGPYAHAFHSAGRDAEAPAVLAELEKIRQAGQRIRQLGMRFNAGHALNYYNVQPVARLVDVRELHIGHAIVSRSIFVGLREAVREMKQLMREAAQYKA
jgi:pyridoxine 5'-phosphate synthase PdxJ